MLRDVMNYLGPLLTFLGVILAPELGRRAGKKKIEAVLISARAHERQAATADWAAFTAALSQRLSDVERRLAIAEARSDVAEQRAAHTSRMYALALAYLRRVMQWVDENWTDHKDKPEPPDELLADLIVDDDDDDKEKK